MPALGITGYAKQLAKPTTPPRYSGTKILPDFRIQKHVVVGGEDGGQAHHVRFAVRLGISPVFGLAHKPVLGPEQSERCPARACNAVIYCQLHQLF
jgi:hypothetical protein